MVAGLSTIDLLGLVGPFAVYLALLLVYYVWEGRRERRLRSRYDEQSGGG